VVVGAGVDGGLNKKERHPHPYPPLSNYNLTKIVLFIFSNSSFLQLPDYTVNVEILHSSFTYTHSQENNENAVG